MNMIDFLKNKTYPIGLDMTEDVIRVAQLGNTAKGLRLIAGSLKTIPQGILYETKEWQTWAQDSIAAMLQNTQFKGREIIAAIPASQVFVDYIKLVRIDHRNANLDETVLAGIKQKLPFDPDKTIVKYITTEDDSVLVVASKKEIIDKYLQIFEEAKLQVKAINIWPAALTNCYTQFFGRRKSDQQAIVMLLNIEQHDTNVVICRAKKLLFARSIPIGAKKLHEENAIAELIEELVNCRRYFASLQKGLQIERLVFLSGQQLSDIRRDHCTSIAEQLKLPAQIGDCLAAVKTQDFHEYGVDRRQQQYSWATAFGLSIS
ncbi:MAG: hypothetical protein FVQ80_04170 [Planctomycetes bacterium]|nr:hypothetical protein [Planctomycetota bacterium]